MLENIVTVIIIAVALSFTITVLIPVIRENKDDI